MAKNTCSQCGKASYTRMCEDCLSKFDWSEYEDYFTRATYSLEDDKLRLYNVSGRLPDPLYDALVSLGFQRAPAQGWYGQVWTPTREDVVLELCEEIEDEDVTAEERAANRQARYATYSDNAAKRARAAAKRGAEIQQYIPLGQPILVGHHSEKRARKDLERLQRLASEQAAEFDRAAFWRNRSQSSLYHAHRQQSREVVMRRIKKLESELRKEQKHKLHAEQALEYWGKVEDHPQALRAANNFSVSGIFPPEQYPGSSYGGPQSFYSALCQFLDWHEARQRAMATYYRSSLSADRWIEHLEGQVDYWKSMLVEKHGEDIDVQLEIRKGQWVRTIYYGNELWGQVVKINRSPATKRITTVKVENVRGSYYYQRLNCWPFEWIKEVADSLPPLDALKPESEPESEPEPEPDTLEQERRAARAAAEQAQTLEVQVNYDPDFFPTPPELVSRMVWLADLHPGYTCLEPSAGDGRIADAMWRQVRGKGGNVLCCETNPTAQQTLEGQGYTIVEADFLNYQPALTRFNRIVMNPPFSREQDIQHVQHAYELLAPGGKLVAIMSEHGFFASTKRAQAFRQWLELVGAQDERLDPDTFASSGTQVQTRIVVITKPVELPAVPATPVQTSLW